MNKYIILILGLFVLISLSLINAGTPLNNQPTLCHQETTNKSSSLDTSSGICNYNYSGTYDFRFPDDGTNYFMMNYTVTNNTLNYTAQVRYKGGCGLSYRNYSIPNSCIINNNVVLILNYSTTGLNYRGFDCWNSTDWHRLSGDQFWNCGATGEVFCGSDTSPLYDGDYDTSCLGIATVEGSNTFDEALLWYVNYSLLENSQTFNNITTEYETEEFIINLTYDPLYYPIINARLNYNGTSYLGTKSGTGSNVIFSKDLDINYTSVEGENRTFYWRIELTNATGTYYFNSTFNNQSVYTIGLDNCTTYSTHALNFTAYNQRTLNKILGWNFKGTFNYFIGKGSLFKNYSTTINSINEANICIKTNNTYKITGQIQYSADNYATTDYNFINFEISNQTNNLSLYLLNLSFSTSFIIKVQDNNQVPLIDYLVYIYRYDTGNPTPYLVQTTKTDSSGKSIGFFETETVDYKFIITDNLGVIVYSSNKQKIIPETTPYTLIFTVGFVTPSPFIYYDNFTGLDYSLSFNKNTFLVTYIYTDSNSSFSNASLLVKYLNASNNQSVVCYLTSEDPSRLLICDIGNYSGTYSATAYISRGDTLLLIDNLIFNIDVMSKVLGNLGLLVGFFIILICGTAFLYNEVAGLISINVGIIFVQLIGLISFGWVFIFGVIAISIIAMIILERG